MWYLYNVIEVIIFTPRRSFDIRTMDLDNILQEIGEFGIYQKLVLVFLIAPACLFHGSQSITQVIVSVTPDHWCRLSESKDDKLLSSVIHSTLLNRSISASCYTLQAQEIIGQRHLATASLLLITSYTSGHIVIGLLSYAIRDWRMLTLCMNAPFIMTLILQFWFLPESPRYLLSIGNKTQLVKVLGTIRKFNRKSKVDIGKSIEGLLHERRSDQGQKFELTSFLDLFRTPNLRKKTLLVSFLCTANETACKGLSLYVPKMWFDARFTFVMSGIVELPGHFLMCYLIDRWGRKWPQFLSTAFAGIACCSIVIWSNGPGIHALLLYLLGKFSVIFAIQAVLIYGAELFPTTVRGRGLVYINLCVSFLSIFVPYVDYLGKWAFKLPLFILGMLLVLGSLSVLFLPETLGQRIPQTVEEGERFGKTLTWKELLRCPTRFDRRQSKVLRFDRRQSKVPWFDRRQSKVPWFDRRQSKMPDSTGDNPNCQGSTGDDPKCQGSTGDNPKCHDSVGDNPNCQGSTGDNSK
ncbi:carcinine transporter-like isoform X5 [Tachypleus tridentatus]|uniref:carcinine transporter-like isoform X5 n=1 Tax=Tachypleus tridentatus TaxID=6853 RepID=UPI003FCF38AD